MFVRRRPTLPQRPRCSTIGAGGLSFRVRNVAGRFPSAMATETLCGKFVKHPGLSNYPWVGRRGCWPGGVCLPRVAQWMRVVVCCGQVLGLLVPVSSNLLLGFHFRPINPVV